MAATVRIKDLLAGETNFDRPSGQHRELGSAKLVRKHVAFATKATANRRSNDAHTAGRQTQDSRQGAMHIVRRLGSAPQGEMAIRRVLRHRGMLLHRQVRVTLEEEGIFSNVLRLVKTCIHITELQGHDTVHVPHPVVVVNAVLRIRQGLRNGH